MDNAALNESNQVRILDGQQRLTTLQILLNELYLLKHTVLFNSENKTLSDNMEMIKNVCLKRAKIWF